MTSGVLPDTSVWVDYLRAGGRAEASQLDGMLEAGEVLACGPVAAELIGGSRGHERDAIRDLLRALPWAQLDREAWLAVGSAAGELRRRGQTLPLTDVEIGVAAARAGVPVWSADTDFEKLAEVVPDLRVRLLE